MSSCSIIPLLNACSTSAMIASCTQYSCSTSATIAEINVKNIIFVASPCGSGVSGSIVHGNGWSRFLSESFPPIDHEWTHKWFQSLMHDTATSFHTLFLKLAGNDLWDWMKASKGHMYMLGFPWSCLSCQAVYMCVHCPCTAMIPQSVLFLTHWRNSLVSIRRIDNHSKCELINLQEIDH